MGCCFSTPSTGSVDVISSFGKFSRINQPGLNILVPCLGESVAGNVSLRVHELRIRCETKTMDNVFVTVQVSVQYEVIPEHVEKAFYRLSNTSSQIEAYVFDVIRSELPKMDLDVVFTNKATISDAIKKELTEAMDDFGYRIISTPVTDIDPAQSVKAAMNEIQKHARLRVAAESEGEAHRILAMKKAQAHADATKIQAEAEADAKALSGQGVARQRRNIIHGMRDDVKEFSDDIKDIDAHTVMETILLTQYMDTLKDIGAGSRSNSVFIPTSIGSISDLTKQLRQNVQDEIGRRR